MINCLNNIFRLLAILLTILLVGCTCLPFSSPFSKTLITGTLSYSDIVTYIGMDVKGNPTWSEITGQYQTLSYSIAPTSPYVAINKDTGEITVLAQAPFSNHYVVNVEGYENVEGSISTELFIEVSPPFLENVANINDGDTLDIFGVHPLALAEVEGSTYLFVGPQYNDEMSIFSIGSDGSPVYVDGITDREFLNTYYSFHTTTVGGVTYLFLVGKMSSSFNMASVASNGSLNKITNVKDGRDIELSGVISLTTAQVGGITYLFAAGFDDHGVSVFSMDGSGNLSNVANVSDDEVINLLGSRSVTTAAVGETTYLFVAGHWDDGVSVFSVGDDGSLVNVDNVSNNSALHLDNVYSVTTANVGGSTYLFATGQGDSGVSVFSVGNDGTLKNITNVSDDDTLKLEGASGLTTAIVDGTTYLFVMGEFDNGVSMFFVEDNGTLINVANVSDDDILNLDGAWDLTTAVVGETPYLFVSGSKDDGVSIFLINHYHNFQ